MKLKLLPLLILFSTVFYSCNNEHCIDKADELKQIDIEFSNLSITRGRNQAFITYCHEDVVMLMPKSYPVKGKKKITELLQAKSDTTYTLSWKPEYALVSESGELGYTYGIWNFQTKDEGGDEIVENGTYVTIWKKNKEGNWKFVLDAGNEGLVKHEEL